MSAHSSPAITQLVHEATVTSTMDRAHQLATHGAPAGTVVMADVQTAGRGRGGKAWHSEGGRGLWCTLIERPATADGLEVLSLRLGLTVLAALSPVADAPLWLKWPNDIYLGPRAAAGKLAGILVEARWRLSRVEWVAVGLGVNLVLPRTANLPPATHAAALPAGVDRHVLLAMLAPGLRAACAATGPLTKSECDQWATHDLARDRTCSEPVAGTVRGIQPDGALLVDTHGGTLEAHRRGSLVLSHED